MQLFLSLMCASLLVACAADNEPVSRTYPSRQSVQTYPTRQQAMPTQPSRQAIQAACSRMFSHVSDPMTRGGKIKGCMRSRGAL